MSRIAKSKLDIKTALTIYYSTQEIGNADIKKIFGGWISNGTVQKRKSEARKAMAECEPPVRSWNPSSVNTEIAFKSWGIDIAKIEKNYKKLLSLGLEPEA